MKIIIDARTVFAKARRGTGKNLVDLYAQIEQKRPSWEIEFCYSKGLEAYGSDLNFTRIKQTPILDIGNRYKLWQDYFLPLRAKLKGANILHCPAQTSPKLIGSPTIVTIHDIIPLRMNDGMQEADKQALENNIAQSLEKAKAIITVSEYSKNDILDYFGRQYEDKIKVVHWAPEGKLLSPSSQANQKTVLNEYTLQNQQQFMSDDAEQSPFFFALGAASPRKNTHKLIHAFAQFCAQNTDWKLLIGGIQANALETFSSLVDELGLNDRVSLNGFLPEAHMPHLYSACHGFVFPSLYEGFGLPVLDAFASNSPLLVSNVTSLPEVAGDAALYFDPNSTEQIADSMLQLANSEALQHKMIEAGQQRLQQFSWENTANQVISLFEQVGQ